MDITDIPSICLSENITVWGLAWLKDYSLLKSFPKSKAILYDLLISVIMIRHIVEITETTLEKYINL